MEVIKFLVNLIRDVIVATRVVGQTIILFHAMMVRRAPATIVAPAGRASVLHSRVSTVKSATTTHAV